MSIDEIIARYTRHIKKAEQLNTTTNKHYAEKKSVVYWLNVLKSYISPSCALSHTTSTNVYNDILFDNIEKAIGVPLNDWQRDYIITGTKKMNDETIAVILRQLLNNTAEPINLKTKNFDVVLDEDQKDCYDDIVLLLHNQLESAGIPVRQVLT